MRKFRNTVWACCICLSILASANLAQAQSGRRQPRVAPAAPIPTPTPEPTPTPKETKKDTDLILLVGVDRNNAYSIYPYSFYDAVITGCAEALRKSPMAGVDVTEKNLPRGEAIKKAKSDDKTYVVLLELRAESLGPSSANTSYDQVILEYVVFAPGTAKVVSSGRTYQNANRTGPLVVGPPGGTGTVLYREPLLRRAGQDAGERILRSLHLGSDPNSH